MNTYNRKLTAQDIELSLFWEGIGHLHSYNVQHRKPTIFPMCLALQQHE